MCAFRSFESLLQAFIGDGKYTRDGGHGLQILWQNYTWKAIPRCDGRYTCRATNGLNPSTLLGTTRLVCLRERSDQYDGVVAGRFLGGGGVLSYQKRHSWVHTLNTDSGLCRKLLAIGMCDQFIHTLDPRPRLIFRSIERLLSCIAEPERTVQAPAAAAAIRLGLARAAIRSFKRIERVDMSR